MTQDLTPAQQTQLDNRDATGQFKAKNHGEPDPGADPLGLGDSDAASTATLLSEDERQVLQDDSFDRARYQEASEQAYYEELAGHLDDDRTFNGSDAYDGQLEDYAADADRHNAHVAAKIAFSAPAEATVAQISQGEAPVCYDRNGGIVDDPEAGDIQTDFHRDDRNGISMVPADMRHHQDSDLGGEEGTEWLDLEAARADSDVHHGSVDVGAPPRSEEVKALQTKANLRCLTDCDVVYKGDHVQSGPVSGSVVGTAFDAGVNDIQVFSHRGIETVYGESASTSRQRDITV